MREEGFSYFRAEGQSLAEILTVEKKRAQREEMLRPLKAHFGALDIFPGYGYADGGPEAGIVPRILGLLFRPDDKLPGGWTAVHRSPDRVLALPDRGSPDLAAVRTLEMALRKELLLFTPDMSPYVAGPESFTLQYAPEETAPARDLLSNAFVRTHTRKDSPDFREGALEDGVTDIFDGGSAGWKAGNWQSVDYAKIGGAYYIRVPNVNDAGYALGTQRPLMRPEGAVQVSLDEMLGLDRREVLRREVLDQAEEMLAGAAGNTEKKTVRLEAGKTPAQGAGAARTRRLA